MTKKIGRRGMLKLAAAGLVSGTVVEPLFPFPARTASKTNRLDRVSTDRWDKTFDRIWLGGEYWANPMENWRISGGSAECTSKGGNRSVHSLIHQLVKPDEPFRISVKVRRVEQNDKDGGASIRLGVRSEINEYRSNCFIQKGIDAGIIENQLLINGKKISLSQGVGDREIQLVLKGTPQQGSVAIQLEAVLVETGETIGRIDSLIAGEDIKGNVAIVSNFAIPSVPGDKIPIDKLGCRYAFKEWEIAGQAFTDAPEQKFGPILWSMYSLSDSRSEQGFVLKLSAFTGPLGEDDNQMVELQFENNGAWNSAGTARLHPDAWVAAFNVPNWNEKVDAKFRLVYREKLRDQSEAEDTWSGVIKANPASSKLRMAALTCQKDYAFPYGPVANNVVAMAPDLVLFSGDQIYEDNGGFGMIRAPAELAILNYLRKYYQFGWAFREAMRNQPTICLPDDHDVLQGNLWGEGGASMGLNPAETGGVDVTSGYIEPIRMLNVVHRTHTAHHPDPYDPTPTPRGLSVYFGEMVYGGVSFAILADRQWKSGPERINVQVGVTGQEEDPLFVNPKFDREGLELLGKRQEDFLGAWSKDWRNHRLKAVLSQTVFAGISTHQPRPDRYLKYDFDSSGWPASARNRAINAMRDSMALHICGDTHLGTLSQYGVQNQRDSNWAFCTPAIAAGWPRWWLPDDVGLPHTNRPEHGLPQTGEFLDSFGNKIYVYAVGNPIVSQSTNRYVKAHEKGSGFGFIIFDTKSRTYTVNAYRFLIDPNDGKPNNQFPGWPVTIHQEENKGNNKLT